MHAARWHTDSVVLLGDAAHTAHYSIGSGTKLAMEDAIELVAALDAADDLPGALNTYEAMRRPAVERLQGLARRSQHWWDSFPERLDLQVDRLDGGVHVPGRERPAGTLRAEQPGRRPPGAHGLRGDRAGRPRCGGH